MHDTYVVVQGCHRTTFTSHNAELRQRNVSRQKSKMPSPGVKNAHRDTEQDHLTPFQLSIVLTLTAARQSARPLDPAQPCKLA